MGSIDLETANMYSDEEDDLPPITDDMPPLSPTRGDEPMTNGGESGPFDDIPMENGDANESATQRPKRMVHRKPIPKLDPARLTSDRGLPTIMKHFENLKFKGKGHEVSDLNTLMMTMEHWGNRLFPKMTFDEVIERIEKLGKKKPVQVCLQKIRMDMPLLDEDFVGREEEPDDVIRGEPEEPNEDDQLPDLPNATTTPGNVSYGMLDITNDQKKRMEENKRKAMEKRAARMQQQSSQNTTGITADELPDNSQTNKRIDSDEEDLENEMWNDLISSQQTSTQRPQSNNDNKSKKLTTISDIDSDAKELEKEAWNEISWSQVQKPVEHCPEYDDETDDDDDYEEYLAKLKGIKLKSDGGKEVDSVVLDKTGSTFSSQIVENNEQSLSILKEDGQEDNVAMATGEIQKDDEEEQSQSILGDNVDSQASKKVDESKVEKCTGDQQSVTDKDMTQDGSEKVEVQKGSQEEKTVNPDVGEDDEATCLPEEDTPTCLPEDDTPTCLPEDDTPTCLPEEDTQLVGEAGPTLQDEEATCLPEEYSEEYSEECADENVADLETQLLEEDTAAMETQAMDVPADTVEADTVAMATQEVKESDHVDTAEADTMEYEAMDTAEAETQALK